MLQYQREYNDIEDKCEKFLYEGTKKITTKSQVTSFFGDDLGGKSNFGDLTIFRGVSEAKWKIISSCQRTFLYGKVFGDDMRGFIRREIDALEESIDGLLKKYYEALGVPITDFIYLSFLQHYGAATTLIDFTRDCKTALWMAASNVQYSTSYADGIGNYFSLYWIDKEGQDKIPKILKKYKDGYVNMLSSYSIHKEVGIDAEYKFEKIVEDKDLLLKEILKFIKWDNGLDDSCLSKIKLGFIDTSNKSKYDKRLLEQFKEELQSAAKSLFENKSDSAYKKFKNISLYIFIETVRIANLNLVAQDGCFIHYLPDSYLKPLEENETMTGIIHCVDIHKSLAPFILEKLAKNEVRQESMFPDVEEMARDALKSAQSLE